MNVKREINWNDMIETINARMLVKKNHHWLYYWEAYVEDFYWSIVFYIL